MIWRSARIACVFLLLGATSGWIALAQGRPPGGGGPPGGPPPGAPPIGAPSSGPDSGPGSAPAAPKGASRSSRNSHGYAGATHSSLGFGPVGRWWDDKSVIQTIGLRQTQQQKMDAIFHASKPEILATYKNFLSKQKKLDDLNKNPNADKAQLFSAIDAVNQARAALQKATSQMLLRIRSEMNQDQIKKLEKLP